MTDSLYAKYVEERQGMSTIWRPHGFVTYRIFDVECFIQDMFIEQTHRLKNKGRELLNDLAELAKKNGCETITANIHLADPNANHTLKAILACGFAVKDCGNRVLVIVKDIKGE